MHLLRATTSTFFCGNSRTSYCFFYFIATNLLFYHSVAITDTINNRLCVFLIIIYTLLNIYMYMYLKQRSFLANRCSLSYSDVNKYQFSVSRKLDDTNTFYNHWGLQNSSRNGHNWLLVMRFKDFVWYSYIFITIVLRCSSKQMTRENTFP